MNHMANTNTQALMHNDQIYGEGTKIVVVNENSGSENSFSFSGQEIKDYRITTETDGSSSIELHKQKLVFDNQGVASMSSEFEKIPLFQRSEGEAVKSERPIYDRGFLRLLVVRVGKKLNIALCP